MSANIQMKAQKNGSEKNVMIFGIMKVIIGMINIRMIIKIPIIIQQVDFFDFVFIFSISLIYNHSARFVAIVVFPVQPLLLTIAILYKSSE